MAEENKTDFEGRMLRLQEIVRALEQGGLSLEESVAMYKEGLGLVRACRELLENAKLEIKMYTEQGLEAFAPKDPGGA